MAITVSVNKSGNNISVTTGGTSVSVPAPTKTISINNTAIPEIPNPANATITSTGSLSATTVQDAFDELANNDFRQENAPAGSAVQEGDTWYDTNDNEYKIYRETSSGVFQWVPIMVGSPNSDSDTLDAGAF